MENIDIFIAGRIEGSYSVYTNITEKELYAEYCNSDKPSVVPGAVTYIVKHAKGYIYYELKDTGNLNQRGRNGGGSVVVGMVMPPKMQLKDNASPYDVLTKVLDFFYGKYTRPSGGGSKTFVPGNWLNDHSILTADLEKIKAVFSLQKPTEYLGYITMSEDAAPGKLKVSKDKLAAFFRDTQYEEFGKYSYINICTECNDTTGFLDVNIPRKNSGTESTANTAKAFSKEWLDFKTERGEDIDKLFYLKEKYLDKIQRTDPMYGEISGEYSRLKTLVLDGIKKNPGGYSKNEISRLLDGIVSFAELRNTGVVTDESWDYLNRFSDIGLPWAITSDNPMKMSDKPYCLKKDSDLTKYKNATDVYFFGVPGTGKSCLLMGLSGLNGKYGFVFNSLDGGEYMTDLQCFLHSRHTPGPTVGNFAAVIRAEIKDDSDVKRKVNLIEMAGEDFLYRLSMNDKVDFGNMGEGVSNMLKNGNRKVFFFVIDPTKEKIKVDVSRMGRGNGGFVFREQNQILKYFGDLLCDARYADVIRYVDAIHIVITKADTLADSNLEKFLTEHHYDAFYHTIKDLCEAKRIYNEPPIGYSIGKLYVGDIFDYIEDAGAKKILGLIKASLPTGRPMPAIIEKLMKWLNNQ